MSQGFHRPPFPRPLVWVTLISVLFGHTACGPSVYEASAAVLLATPVVVMLAWLILVGLHRVWERVRPVGKLGWRTPGLLSGLALAMGVFAMVGEPSGDSVTEWWLAAFWFFGSSFIAVALLVWRIAFAISPERAARNALSVASAILVLPAVPALSSGAGSTFFEWAIASWVYPGVFGISPLVLLVVLFSEAAVRRRRAGEIHTISET